MSYIENIINTVSPSQSSAFGTPETAGLTPIFQADYVHGLNNQLWKPAVTSGTGATVDTNGGRLRIQSGTSGTGYAYVTNRIPARYRAGQGMVARFTPLFTSGVALNVQGWGVGNMVANAPYDGYFFAYNGTSFGIVHYLAGTPTWYARSTDWNGDKVDGSAGSSFNWNPTYGTPCMIKYPYLGYGDISFYVQHPTTQAWVLVHTIRYANTTASTQLTNPTLNFIGFTINSGNTTNVTMYGGSIGMFISGERSFVGNPKGSYDYSKSGITTETNIISLQNATTYNGIPNRGLIRLTSISFGTSGSSGEARARIKIGATLGGTPAYTPYNGSTADNGVTITSGNSIASYDVAGTTVTGGRQEFVTVGDNPNSSGDTNLIPYDIFIPPGEIATISGYSSSTSAVVIGLNWSEDI